jgi:hypothetical protein
VLVLCSASEGYSTPTDDDLPNGPPPFVSLQEDNESGMVRCAIAVENQNVSRDILAIMQSAWEQAPTYHHHLGKIMSGAAAFGHCRLLRLLVSSCLAAVKRLLDEKPSFAFGRILAVAFHGAAAARWERGSEATMTRSGMESGRRTVLLDIYDRAGPKRGLINIAGSKVPCRHGAPFSFEMGRKYGALALLGLVVLAELLSGRRSHIDLLRDLPLAGLFSKQERQNDDDRIELDDVVYGPKPIRRLFYILPMPELTTWLVGNYTQQATAYYNHKALNEEMAEVWLHRAFMNHPDRTDDPENADIIMVCGYLHLNFFLLRNVDDQDGINRSLPMKREEWARLLLERLLAVCCKEGQTVKTAAILLATPTWNPSVSDEIGINHMSRLLQSYQVPTLMALGFERNEAWSRVPTELIVPIPYVATPSVSREELLAYFDLERTHNFLFYAGDQRRHADAWAGCNRSRLVEKLANRQDMDVGLRTKASRISQDDYNRRMLTSDFCLILCGDTPTSRSLTSAVLHGCVPLIIGSRLRGFCEPPCHKGWGWYIAEQSHIPYSNLVEWDFPGKSSNLRTMFHA